MIGPISRIIGRMVASALMTYGFVSPEYSTSLDNDLAIVFGLALSAFVEVYYWIAKRRGWAT